MVIACCGIRRCTGNISARDRVNAEPAVVSWVDRSVLETAGLVRRFGRTAALAGVDFRVGSAEIVGVIGPNGSGKTTLLNLIAGKLRPTGGRILFSGYDVTYRPPHTRARLGIARCSQIVKPPIG